MSTSIDILMITYNRAAYTRLALQRLLATCDGNMRVWLWHNGDDGDTLEVVRGLSADPHVHEFFHSRENRKLRDPTNWLWENGKGDFVCKVDDDCLMPDGWADTLRQAHADVPELGVVGCWRFPESDFLPDVAGRKTESFNGGHRIMRNLWVEGSGYLMKRRCIEENGLLGPSQSFTAWCTRLAAAGWINGWYFPFLYQEHMDDPRSPNSLLKTDADLERYLPLSAQVNGVTTLREWEQQLRRSASLLQHASYDPASRAGWRRVVHSVRFRMRSLLGERAMW
jgi:glycosyltransferase involved in cell wall biosynthesis